MIYEQNEIAMLKLLLGVVMLGCVLLLGTLVCKIWANYGRLRSFRRNLKTGDWVRTKQGEARVRANYGDTVLLEFKDRPRRVQATDIYEIEQRWILL